jgi:hypothetical protein
VSSSTTCLARMAPLPTGRFLFAIFDARTLGVTDISLSGSDARSGMPGGVRA